MDLAECVFVGGTEIGVGALELLQQEREQATVKKGFFFRHDGVGGEGGSVLPVPAGRT